MAIDPRKLRPSELVRLLNSTPLGAVIDDRQLYRHRQRAGMRIGDGQHVDLIRYAAWLLEQVEQMHAAPAVAGDTAGERHRELMAAKSRANSSKVADIGEIPPVADPARRESCRLALFNFLTIYFPNSTGRNPFSEDHRRAIARLERCALQGGRFLQAVYRGFAKTTIGENAALWAVLYGHRRFVDLLSQALRESKQSIDSLKLELSENDLLLADFPEVCHPIRALENKPQRCASQTHRGKLTHIEWKADTIVLPTILVPAGWGTVDGSAPDASLVPSAASGGVIVAKPFKKSRGIKHKAPNGTQLRPDFTIVDDPQDDESASSPARVTKMLGVLRRDVLKGAGHGKTLACVVNATIIHPDDMIEQLLKDGSWQGERVAMVKAWSRHHEKLWMGEYARLRSSFDRSIVGDQERAHAAATEFYRERRATCGNPLDGVRDCASCQRANACMDADAVIGWHHCYDTDVELSAVQHAYNMFIDDGEEAFASECQNQPLADKKSSSIQTAEAIAARVCRLRRGELPLSASHVTAFIDVGGILFYIIVSWEDDFTGTIIDYGGYPDQKRPYFTAADAKRTLAKAFPNAGLEGRIYAGLEALVNEQAARRFRRDDGAELQIERCLIDANWGDSTDVVYQFCRQSQHSGILLPSHGRFVGAKSVPFNEYKPRVGDRVGHHWRQPNVRGRRQVRYVIYDTNYWKSFVHARLAVPMGDATALSLFGDSPAEHKMLADHCTAEYPDNVTSERTQRTVAEWRQLANRDNHLLDCLVGAAVAASIQGCSLPGVMASRPRRVTKTLAQLAQEARR